MSTSVPRLELLNITKRYPTIVANADVSLSVMPGEIHAILGENGAGKSTLMKIIYGAVKADAGTIRMNGEDIAITNPAQARRLGIGMVFQHFSLFETLTVAENIALVLDEPFDLAALSQRVKQISERYGLPLDPDRRVHSLSVGERQRVEIVRCLLQNPTLLILDEPTSVLTPQAVEKLFDTLRQLAAEGVSILYISHKLHEIQALCDRATILRNGRVTGTANPREESPASLARMMIGRELPVCEAPPYLGERRPMLTVQHLNLTSAGPFGSSLHDVSLTVHSGEILGIAGISGNGQAELMAAISGEHPVHKDAVRLDGKPIGHLNAGNRRAKGLVYVPEERLGRGTVPPLSLSRNALLTAHRHGMKHWGLVRYGKARDYAEECVARFDVRGGGAGTNARALSGGNLQKFIVGREIMLKPKVMIVAQPTWGVDVGAAAVLRQALLDLSRTGVAILVVSEELEELFEICDSIAVLAQGRLSPAQPKTSLNAESVGLQMAGLFPKTPLTVHAEFDHASA
ncbi:ABC transporter ATP-binding protein [uncultured Propionivibrio sp.]|uniref:ABC transporter ATP-binding protein n=1 Tax=uncultured Propionivibrio sp. TaxID=426737 RepID=UPI0029C099B4|nr:ABC transporter ATP-binding protein [uncultured Propionivibrio sp.]